VKDSRYQGDKACRIMEAEMLESIHEHAEYLHMYAAHAHAAAAAAHRRCDYRQAEELSATAQAFSSNAAEKTEEIAKQIPE
jgi:hypothetical protein